MPLTLKVTKGKGFEDFSAMCKQLASLTGADLQEVIDGEFAGVLQLAAAKTKIAPANKIISDHNKQKVARYDIPYAGNAGNTSKQKAYFAARAAQRRGKASGNGMLYGLQSFVSRGIPGHGPGRHKHPDWLWSQIQDKRRSSLAKKLAKAGVSARHIWELAQSLGLSISVEARAKNARADFPFNVQGRRFTTSDGYNIMGQIINRTAVAYAGIGRAIQAALRARRRGMDKALAAWAKGKMHLVAKRYPHLLKVS